MGMSKLRFYFLLFFTVVFYNTTYGQTLSASDTSNVHFLNARKFFIYKVDKGETLFGISQKFKIPQEEILQFNHEINKTGLKPKMKLWIPAYSWLKKDSLKVAVIEEKKEKDIFRIAVVTGISLPKIYTAADTSESYVEEQISKELHDNLEFVEGILFSIEKLNSDGFKTHVTIIDSENDSVKTIRKLKKYDQFNLIITNESGSILKQLSDYSSLKNVKLFTYGINATDLIRENHNSFALMPSSGTQCKQMGKFAGKYFTNSVLITVTTPVAKENERSDRLKNGWLQSRTSRIINTDYNKGGGKAVADSLIKDKTNVIFISSSNEDIVSSILNALKNKISDYKFVVIGLPTWQYFETIDQKLIERCNVYLFNSGFINYNAESVSEFRKYFRDKYYTEPSEFAYYGYDAMLVAGKSFLKNGFKLIDEKDFIIRGIYSDYDFFKESEKAAYENEIIHVFQPTKDSTIDIMKNFKLQ